jgi:Lon protease-like protein
MTLPLFPLATVLFPGGLLPLRVFEQRYIELAKRSIRDDSPFGVCLIGEGAEVMGPGRPPPKFEAIGTLARITDFDMPESGILHLRTRGETRFRVLAHRVEPNGLVVADVVPIDAEPALPLPADEAPLARLVELIANRVGAENFPSPHRLDDASWVGYRLAEALPLPPGIRQRMLEINDAGVRLQVLRRFLQQQGLVP